MSKPVADGPAKDTTGGPPPFARRYAFEPEPGQVGMGEDELRAIGEIGEAVTGGAFSALAGPLGLLKGRRESMGLSLDEVSERSDLDRRVIGEWEGGSTLNPPLDTLSRYSMAPGLLVTLGVEDIQPEGEDSR